MPSLDPSDFNVVVTLLGGFITVFGLVSYLIKERFFISAPLPALLFGVLVSHHGLGWVLPLVISNGSHETLEQINLNFSRVVLAVTLFLAGVGLPSKYVEKYWKSLAVLLGPVMTMMWMTSALIIWALVPNLGFIAAMAIAACVTPTDPVLSNSIVKGRFAESHVPEDLQTIISAESGANDGLAYPFLFLALYLIKYNTGHAIGQWVLEAWLYVVVLSIVLGIGIGYLARISLSYATKKDCVDRESFFVHAICLALFTMGLCGMIGTDDLLACFVAGCTFTHDDWFKEKMEKDSLQASVDMLLNLAMFMWIGAVIPWHEFRTNASGLTIWTLIAISVLVLCFRRLPAVWLLHKFIPAINGHRQALFTGFFGPIGVGAVFYLHITREFLLDVEGDEAERLSEIVRLVVWFLVVSSIFVHGLAIPVIEFGLDSHKDTPAIFHFSLTKFVRGLFGRNDRTIADAWEEGERGDGEHI